MQRSYLMPMKKKYSVLFWTAGIILPLIAGLTIYIIFRPDTFIAEYFYELTGYKSEGVKPNNPFYDFIKFHLCDMLWAFSFTFVCVLIMGTEKQHMLMSLGVCLAFEALIELLQKTYLMPGSFDIWDMVLEFFATIIAMMLINVWRK